MAKKCSRWIRCVMTTLLILGSGAVSGQTYPSKPIRMMVGYAAGGSTDWMARLVAAELTATFPQGFVVDNRTGASGVIASTIVSKSSPDGYTLVVVGGTHSRVPSLYPDAPYDNIKSFSCMGLIAGGPYVLVVHPTFPAKNVPEFLTYLKKNPGTVYASPGAGTGQHMTVELLKSLAGISMTDVHYKGSGALRADLLSGRVKIAFDNISLMLPLIRDGTLRPLAITDSQRFVQIPDVPTLAESGFPGFEVIGWFAVLTPAKTPKDRIETFNKALNHVLAKPDLAQNLLKIGARPMIVTPKTCDDLIAAETEKWGKLVRAGGIKP